MFITFEGPDGSGKTTQVKRIGRKLIEKGFDIVYTREPGGT
ncbi:MAG TPA: dTMP kinase, partial [Flexilinea sp.]|nr:dTMP kinase [Flexilinea sp.]